DDVRKLTLDAAKGANAPPQEEGGDRETENEPRQIDGAFAADNAPAKTVDDADHRIEIVEEPPAFGHDRARETHWRDIEAELKRERNDEAEVAIFDHDRRRPNSRPQARQ